MAEPSRIMPNIYFLGFKVGQAWHFVHQNSGSLVDKLPPLEHVLQKIYDFPTLYGNWWMNLVRKDPIHVLVETTLILSILFVIFARSKDWKENEEHLSKKEEEELLREWKLHGRAPLTPASPGSEEGRRGGGGNHNNSHSSNLHQHESASTLPIVVHKVHGAFMDVSLGDTTPPHQPIAANNNKPSHKPKSSYQKSTAFLQTQPQPLQQPQQPQTSNISKDVFTVLNFATYDYLGMSSNQPSVRKAADDALNAYGCGSCGPRGFYGTIDAHLDLEKAFASFLKTDGAILYSDGASTCASTIAAFAKRGDLLVCDEGIYEPLRTGVTLSRAHVKWFKHNDMQDLRRVLTKIHQNDQKVKRPINAQRRFLVVEGLYKDTGTIVPLQELVQLKHEFSYRLILDESNSFGTLGKTGRGVHELHNCRLMHDVEITTLALENSMGGIGGITVGTEEVVEHQRLSGSGYCFSASSPPFTATAAVEALRLLQSKPETTLQPLQDNVAYLHHKLTQLCHDKLEDVLLVTSAPQSPILFLQVADIPETKDLEELLFLQEVVNECLQPSVKSIRMGMALVVVSSPPGIRITVTAAHTHEHLDTCLRIFSEAVEVVMSQQR